MSLIIPYSEPHTQLTPEQNEIALEKVAEIIRNNQLRSTGFTEQEIHILLQLIENHKPS